MWRGGQTWWRLWARGWRLQASARTRAASAATRCAFCSRVSCSAACMAQCSASSLPPTPSLLPGVGASCSRLRGSAAAGLTSCQPIGTDLLAAALGACCDTQGMRRHAPPMRIPPCLSPTPCASPRAGLFMAPQTTGEALKGGRLVAEVLARGGFTVIPAPGLPDTPSMITAVELGSRERMVAFCRWGGGRWAAGSRWWFSAGGEGLVGSCLGGWWGSPAAHLNSSLSSTADNSASHAIMRQVPCTCTVMRCVSLPLGASAMQGHPAVLPGRLVHQPRAWCDGRWERAAHAAFRAGTRWHSPALLMGVPLCISTLALLCLCPLSPGRVRLLRLALPAAPHFACCCMPPLVCIASGTEGWCCMPSCTAHCRLW